MTKRLIPARGVCERFGGISLMTLWRWLEDENMKFPRPTIIRNRRYFDDDEIEAFHDRMARKAISKRAA